MSKHDRIGIAKNALELFMRSLPEGCTFSIISFGSNHNPLFHQNFYQTYNDETRDSAIAMIHGFKPDFGGTNILSPLQAA